MPGNASCSESLLVALHFALSKPKPNFEAVLFVITCQNYETFQGISMNSEEYTSYPNEQEILLREGCPVWILGVERIDQITNTHADFRDYAG